MKKWLNGLKLTAASIPLGAAAGIVVWIFLKILSIATNYLWEVLPEYFSGPIYTVAVCTAGGLIVGIFRKKVGDYPEELMVVLGRVKNEKWYDYKKLLILCVAAFLPLVFASSVGPEAGLVGIITALCYWVKDTLIKINKNESLTKITKYLTYPFAIIAGLGCYRGLSMIFGKAMAGFPSFELAVPNGKDLLMGIVYILIGCIFAKYYDLTHHGCHAVGEKIPPIARETVAGLCLGIVVVFVPQMMFSGEEEIHHLMTEYVEYLPWMLIGIALLKVLMTNLCIQFGLKGGHFFPLIYAGVALGYAVAMIVFSADAGAHVIFAAAMVTAAMLGANMKKPVIVTLILLICFPIKMVIWLAIGSFAGSALMSVGKKKNKENVQNAGV